MESRRLGVEGCRAGKWKPTENKPYKRWEDRPDFRCSRRAQSRTRVEAGAARGIKPGPLQKGQLWNPHALVFQKLWKEQSWWWAPGSSFLNLSGQLEKGNHFAVGVYLSKESGFHTQIFSLAVRWTSQVPFRGGWWHHSWKMHSSLTSAAHIRHRYTPHADKHIVSYFGYQNRCYFIGIALMASEKHIDIHN